MAAGIELKNGVWYIRFRIAAKQWKRSLKTENEQEAILAAQLVKTTLHRVRIGQLIPPSNVDLADWIVAGGRLEPVAVRRLNHVTLDELLEGFLQSAHHQHKAPSTRILDHIHVRHLRAAAMANKRLCELTEADLQAYIDSRHKKKKVGRTIKAELALLRSCWNGYGQSNRLVPCDFRSHFPHRLILPKYSEKPPPMTMHKARSTEDWRSVYLQEPEIAELLTELKIRHEQSKYGGAYPWLYPAVVFCACTSFRRSSMQRQRVSDIDFDRHTVTGRICKENTQYVETLRTVPMIARLENVLEEWLFGDPVEDRIHPGGDFLFCFEPDRMLSPRQSHDGLRHCLKKTRFARIGWHTLRHSFVSINAMRGVPLTVTAEFTGHHSDDVARIYRHLSPSYLREQLEGLYDGKRRR